MDDFNDILIPWAMGEAKEGLDEDESECLVFDFVLHPETLASATAEKEIMAVVSVMVS
jgi:hypothetical protein